MTDSKSESQRTQRLIVTEWVSLLAVFLTCFIFLLHRIENLEAKQDARLEAHAISMQAQTERTDKLYEMFIDLLKERI